MRRKASGVNLSFRSAKVQLWQAVAGEAFSEPSHSRMSGSLDASLDGKAELCHSSA